MNVKGQLHTPAILLLQYPFYRKICGPQSRFGLCGFMESVCLPRKSIPCPPAVSLQSDHCTH